MIGWDRWHEPLRQALDALQDKGFTPLLEVVGEPGAGKTRLLSRLAEMAVAHGQRVLSVRATERGGAWGPLLDALGEDLPQLDESADPRAIRRALRELAAPPGLVLILDDVHLADPVALDLLAGLCRRPVPGVLLAIAYRPAQAPGRASPAAGRLRRRRRDAGQRDPGQPAARACPADAGRGRRTADRSSGRAAAPVV